MFILETNHTSKAHCIFDLPSLGFDTTVKKKQHKNSNKGCQSNINTTNHLPDLKKHNRLPLSPHNGPTTEYKAYLTALQSSALSRNSKDMKKTQTPPNTITSRVFR